MTVPEAGAAAAPYIKAAVRDMKAYRDAMGYRAIPIGYAGADVAAISPMLQYYLACGDPDDQIDFFALSSFKWCGSSGYNQSGYSKLTEQNSHLPVPAFFSETGCNTHRPRDFSDQTAIFGDEMTPTWSGAIVYEWIEEVNNFGLVSYGPYVPPGSSAFSPPDGYHRDGTPQPIEPDFSNLKGQWSQARPNAIYEPEYTGTRPPLPCPATDQSWAVDPNKDLPPSPPGEKLIDYPL